ncbi:MAG: bifunctional adenosylcobinamide kinase/adenosylcobinamide-phosphate guanylyltransferase [Magnetococcales bacterium]|nr:bifunctional adenosylcobinamide kinase/adenosylcobinamide-phosphate guanylyltransferase [Magnetococcales bacterium]
MSCDNNEKKNPIFFTGPANSGKSEWVEYYLGKIYSPIYFGVLPFRPEFELIITRHKKRRSSNWRLIESIGDLDADIKLIKKTLSMQISGQLAVFIDGLTNWVSFINESECDFVRTVDMLSLSLGNLINHNTACQWVLMDSVPCEKSEAFSIISSLHLVLPYHVNNLLTIKLSGDKNEDKHRIYNSLDR